MKTKKHSISRSSQKLFVASKAKKMQKRFDYDQDFYQWTFSKARQVY